jgi:hypothetical protein
LKVREYNGGTVTYHKRSRHLDFEAVGGLSTSQAKFAEVIHTTSTALASVRIAIWPAILGGMLV